MSEALDKARALLEQGGGSEAQDACRACLNAGDVTPTDLLDLAEGALQCGDARLAGELLKAVIQDDPAEPLAWLGLARSCMQMGIPSKAAGMLGRCLQYAGDRTDVLTPAAAVLVEMGQSDSAAELLKKSLSLDPDQPDARAALEKLSPTADTSGQSSTGPAGRDGRIAVFCGPDGDTFLKHIIEHLRRSYDVRVFSGRTVDKQNERECLDLVQWCDVAWVEWATNLAAAVTHITPQPPCRVIVRLHRYEAYTPWPTKINWGRVDTLINVGNPVVLDQLRSVVPDIDWKVNHVTLPNGVDMDRYSLSAGERTKEMVFIGNLRPVKNPQLLLQCMHRLRQEDPDYRLHVAGHWDDRQLKQYLLDASRAMGLQEHLLFEGFQKDIDQWLADKSVIVSSSLIESQGMGIMEGMARGLKPIIHRFPGAEHIYHEDHLFFTPEEFTAKVLSDEWDPARYRREIEENYSLALQLDRIDALMASLCPAAQRTEASTPAPRPDVRAKPSQTPGSGSYHRNIVQFGKHTVELWDYQGNHLSRMMRTGQFYECDLLSFVYGRYGTGGVYMDIGACIGNHTMFFAKVCQADRVVAIEPTPETFMLLEHNKLVNQAENVELIQAGLSDQPGWAQLEVVCESNRGMNRLHAIDRSENDQSGIKLIRGDSIDVQDIKLMKIDVEGMVRQVINSCEALIRRDHPVIVAEVEDEPEVFELLMSLGYQEVGKFCATETCVFEWRGQPVT